MKKKIALLIAASMLASMTGCNIAYESELATDGENPTVSNADVVIDFCYTNEAYKEYFEFCEKEFEKQNEDVDIVLHCKAENKQYLDDIVNTTYSEDSFMDVYMLSDSNIGMAYLAGVAAKNTYDVFTEDNYCRTALNACSYGDVLVGYPLSYDTTFLLYRSDLLKKSDISSFYSLMTYSDTADFSSEEFLSIEAIFKCDVDEIFNVYGFIGSGVNLGGPSGVDSTIVDIDNGITERLSNEYMTLLEYFSINTGESYDVILEKFLSGKYLATIGSTFKLDEVLESEIAYGINPVPDYASMSRVAPLSMTQCVVVNMYSPNNVVASDFARFATYEAASYLYDMSAKLSARRGVQYDNAELGNIYGSYEKATIKNKLQYGEQFYPMMEIAIHNIAAGNDIKTELGNVQTHMEEQLK